MAAAPSVTEHPVKVSFVIPAHNEESSIGHCVRSVIEFTPPEAEVDVLVVDNRSTDRTAARARASGAAVLPSSATSVAGVRNHGVEATRGEVIVFLDGDCLLTPVWKTRAADVLAAILQQRDLVVGSHPIAPADDQSYLWRYWFEPYVRRAHVTHLGSAHLICSRQLFERLGGFDETLKTGEDYDFCVRARAQGATLRADPALTVIHDGYPQSLTQFFRRELWHGQGDAGSISRVLSSKVAIISALFVLALAAGAALLVFRERTFGLLALAAALVLSTVATVARFRGAGLRVTAGGFVLMPLYLTARGLALFVGAARHATRR